MAAGLSHLSELAISLFLEHFEGFDLGDEVLIVGFEFLDSILEFDLFSGVFELFLAKHLDF